MKLSPPTQCCQFILLSPLTVTVLSVHITVNDVSVVSVVNTDMLRIAVTTHTVSGISSYSCQYSY